MATNPSSDPPDAELDDGRMPFVAHLRELRDRIRNASIYFILGLIGCWFFSDEIYHWLKVPIDIAWKANADKLGSETAQLHFQSPVTPFWVYMSVAMWGGIFLSSPFTFYQLWKFIAPGLYKRERRIGIVFAACSGAMFAGGALFCYYFVLEGLYTFLLGYAGDDIHPTLFMGEYLDFTRNMMLAFGAIFELPMLIYFLALVGLVTHRGLWKFNRWFVVLAFVIGAILTPSPDAVSQIMMALPMILLYNVSIVVAYLVVRSREKREARDKAAEQASDRALIRRESDDDKP